VAKTKVKRLDNTYL